MVNECGNFLIDGADDRTREKLKKQVLILNSRWKEISDSVKSKFGDKMVSGKIVKSYWTYLSSTDEICVSNNYYYYYYRISTP